MLKAPEKRYQSASGLVTDLVRCRDEYVATGSIDDFPLESCGYTHGVTFISKMVGHDREAAHILEGYEQAAGGAFRSLFISGLSGIGKTRLIQELQKPIVMHKGYFTSGKFDVYQIIQYNGGKTVPDSLGKSEITFWGLFRKGLRRSKNSKACLLLFSTSTWGGKVIRILKQRFFYQILTTMLATRPWILWPWKQPTSISILAGNCCRLTAGRTITTSAPSGSFRGQRRQNSCAAITRIQRDCSQGF